MLKFSLHASSCKIRWYNFEQWSSLAGGNALVRVEKFKYGKIQSLTFTPK